MALQVAGDPVNITEGQVQSALHSVAASEYAGTVRADTARVSPDHVASQRAAIVHYVRTQAVLAARNGVRGDTVSEGRIRDIARAMAKGLGLRERDGRIDGMEHRADVWAGEGVDIDPRIIRPTEKDRALTSMLPTRSIDAAAQRTRIRGLKYEGTADLWRPGTTEYATADFSAGTEDKLVQTLYTTTSIDWHRLLYEQASGVNTAFEQAEAARRVLMDAYERVTVEGGPAGLQGLRQLEAATSISGVDYTGAPTLGEVHRDLVRMILNVQEANDDRGGVPNALFISTTWLRKIQLASNLDAGGSLTGLDLIAAENAASQMLNISLKKVGIDTVIPTPSLNRFGRAPDTQDEAGALVCSLPEDQGLRNVVALAPAPVRTSSNLTSDSTLWVMRLAGLEAPIATSVGKMHAKVR